MSDQHYALSPKYYTPSNYSAMLLPGPPARWRFQTQFQRVTQVPIHVHVNRWDFYLDVNFGEKTSWQQENLPPPAYPEQHYRLHTAESKAKVFADCMVKQFNIEVVSI